MVDLYRLLFAIIPTPIVDRCRGLKVYDFWAWGSCEKRGAFWRYGLWGSWGVALRVSGFGFRDWGALTFGALGL